MEEQGEVRLEEVSGQIAHDALIEQIMNIAPVGKNLIKVTDCTACVPCFMKPRQLSNVQLMDMSANWFLLVLASGRPSPGLGLKG